MNQTHALNRETSLAAHREALTTPTGLFFMRNHFAIPPVDPSWHLHVGGLVGQPLRLDLDELRRMRAISVVATLECAGNGRSTIRPRTDGEPWGLGAVSTAAWTGVPLGDVLDRVRVSPAATHIVMRGADAGCVAGSHGEIHFARSLSVDEARDSGAILAYAMNDEPLPVAHGFPLRVIVPGWYGMASVKWLTGIEAIDGTFDGYFQRERYVDERAGIGAMRPQPVSRQRVRSVIVSPCDCQELAGSDLVVRGLAWSGAAPIARVEVVVGDGEWQIATLGASSGDFAWRWWEHHTTPPGRGSITIRARAMDAAGFVQPDRPEWNRFGYGANGIHAVVVHCR